MKYAVIQTGGKQYRVSEGDIIEVEHLPSEKDQKITFKEVLLYTNDGTATIGTPFVDKISVSAVVVDHIRGEKIRVAKYKAKVRYRRVTGHRQALTRIRIETIGDGAENASTGSAQNKTVKAQKPETQEVSAKTEKAKTRRTKKA